MADLDKLKSLRLPELPPELRAKVDARVEPALRRRRTLRRVRTGGAFIMLAMSLVVASWLLLYLQPPGWEPVTALLTKTTTGLARAELEDLSTQELLARRAKLLSKQPEVSASYMFVPISTVVQEHDLIVQGVVEEVVVDRDRLIDDLASGNLGPLYLTVTFRVVESYPPLKQGRIAISGPGQLEEVPVGREFLLPLQALEGSYLHRWSFGTPTDYRVMRDGDEATVQGLVLGNPMPLADAWKLIRELFDQAHGKIDPDQLSARLEQIKHGSFDEAIAALEALSTAPDAVSEADLIEALEAQYARLVAGDTGEVGDYGPVWEMPHEEKAGFQRLARLLLARLHPVASEQTATRVIDLFQRDLAAFNHQAFEDHELERLVLRLAIKHPGPARQERVLGLLGKRYEYFGKHGGLGSVLSMIPDYGVLREIAQEPGEDIEAIMNAVFANPDRFNLRGNSHDLVLQARDELLAVHAQAQASVLEPQNQLPNYMERYLQGDTWLYTTIALRTQPGDRSLVPFLQENPIPDVIRFKLPDPSFVSALRAMAGEGGDMPYLFNAMNTRALAAMSACGAQDEAVQLATKLLDAPIDDSDFWALGHDVAARNGALLFLGETSGARAAELITRFTQPKVLEEYLRAHERAYARTDAKRQSPYLAPSSRPIDREIYLTALMALARMRDPSAGQAWRAVYADGKAGERVAAAVALFYLGDQTGWELIEPFTRQAEFTFPELHHHFMTEGATGEFQHAIFYLRSPETDALFLERIDHGFSNGDHDVANNLPFLMEHADHILPKLVEHLESREMQARTMARHSLQSILGVQVPWEEAAPAGAQPQAVEQFRKEAEAFLATWAPVQTAQR